MKTKTVEIPNYLLKRMDNTPNNRSELARIAVDAYINDDRLFRNINGKKVITVNLHEDQITYINTQIKGKRFPSGSEFIRLALITFLNKYRVNEVPRELIDVPRDMVYIPSMNGGVPFKTRRLE